MQSDQQGRAPCKGSKPRKAIHYKTWKRNVTATFIFGDGGALNKI